MAVDRLNNWDKFSRHMREYINNQTIQKYSASGTEKTDLMSFAGSPIICVWNILKYTFRIWNGRMKQHDIEKIVHYAEMCWSMSNGQVIDKGQDDVFKADVLFKKAVGE